MNADQGFHVPPQLRIVAAGFAQEVGAVRWVDLLNRFQEDVFRRLGGRGHGWILT
jgi:hypothetical protein